MKYSRKGWKAMKALILIDIQNDFLPGGALAVPDGDKIIPFANKIMTTYDLILATQDWHPAEHKSFASQHEGKKVGDVIILDGLKQILWPDHCIQNSLGAEIAHSLNKERIERVFQKGTDIMTDSYSGFYDNAWRKTTGLNDYLREKQINDITVMGLATDYCVKFTTLEAVKLGFKTTLLLKGCRGVELKPGDCKKAIEDMRRAGVIIQKD